jgi:DNA repair protein RecN (Recombination protein N)
VLGELADQLVTVHGQSDQIRLTSATAQRAALDGFGGPALEKVLAAYVRAYDTWQQHTGELETLTRDRDDRVAEAERIRAASDEIEAADPQPGEDVELADRAERLGNLEELRLSAGLAHEALSSESLDGVQDVVGLVESARRAIERVAASDAELQPVLEQLTELGIQASEASASLSSYLGSLEPDAGHDLELINERRALLAGLTRKYGETVDDVIAYGQRASDRLLELDGDDDRIVALQQAVEQDEQTLAGAAAALTTARTKAAKDLAKRVTAELKSLAMAGATLVVEVSDAGDYRRHGRDQVSILLQPHSGTDPRPIGKGASGGELSRVMLALEVVTGSGDVPTFVFDEVDAGVGGKAALDVGARLAALARSAQVIVVTHLAQVAAFADQHLVVHKTDDGHVTASGVAAVSGDDRLRELARMMAGVEDSGVAIEHARELLAQAGQAVG